MLWRPHGTISHTKVSANPSAVFAPIAKSVLKGAELENPGATNAALLEYALKLRE